MLRHVPYDAAQEAHTEEYKPDFSIAITDDYYALCLAIMTTYFKIC
jgi:hypothetical protein